MNRLAIMIAMFFPLLFSCEKIWETDLREKALDTVRGYYELESAAWEGPEPLDIDGDGNASNDYYSQWMKVDVGHGDFGALLHNDGGYVELPYTSAVYADWGQGIARLQRRVENVHLNITAVIQDDQAKLEFDFPECDAEFEHTGYGEFQVRKQMTFYVLNSSKEAETVTGPVVYRFNRVEYKPN